jgi:hypothetical protein
VLADLGGLMTFRMYIQSLMLRIISPLLNLIFKNDFLSFFKTSKKSNHWIEIIKK